MLFNKSNNTHLLFITLILSLGIKYLHPTSMTNIVKPFSMSVLGATFPKPTLVNDVHVKYNAVMYRDLEYKVECKVANT